MVGGCAAAVVGSVCVARVDGWVVVVMMAAATGDGGWVSGGGCAVGL
jgi:hypothetical protein